MFVKICGTTNLADAELAVELGADALGFIFAPSRRRVSVQQVAAMTRSVPPHVMRVGVFTEPDVEQISRTVSEARLTAVQMHWRYDPEVIGAFRREVGDAVLLWQVVGFPVEPQDQEAAEGEFTKLLRAAVLETRLDYVLLDAAKDGASGGLGQPFSWWRALSSVTIARRAAEIAEGERGIRVPKLLVAGGLNIDNAGEAIAALRPWGVDVVSGVEARPGQKDPERLRRFIRAAREAGERFPPL